MQKKLTEAAIKELEPPAKGYAITWDAELKGFGVRVTAAGAKAFIFNYRTRAGRERRLTIGSPPAHTVASARREARDHAQEVAKGRDPLAARQEARGAPTFADLAKHYIETHLPKKRSAKGDRQVIDGKLLPRLGNLKVAEITCNDLDRIHHRITKEGHPYQANRVASLLSKMFSFAVKKHWRDDNPAKGIERNEEIARERYLSNAELDRLCDALASFPDQGVANAVRLLLLTGARRGEVLGATWDQFDIELGIWSKPSSHTKTKKVHTVPLSAPALELLSEMFADRDLDSRYLFPGRRGGHRVDLKKSWPKICKAANITELRLHDLRHSYASILVRGGASLPMIGKLLGHTQVSTTNRYAHLDVDPLRELTNRVGAVVSGAGKAGAEVVKLRRRGSQ
jgi:integrase